MTDHYCDGKLKDIIRFDDLSDIPMRHRIAEPRPGHDTRYPDRSWTGDINRGFHQQCERWARNIRFHFFYNSPYAPGTMEIAWFGTVGTKACHRPTSGHNRARAYDLSGIQFVNGFKFDSNTAWNSDRSSVFKRRYLGVWASVRRKFVTVLTASYSDNDHTDHIHFDNLSTLPPIRRSAETDTKLVQRASNWLNATNLRIDGRWGRLTEAAYEDLIEGIEEAAGSRLSGDPTRELGPANQFLKGIQDHGISNSRLGEWPGYQR